MSDLEQSYSDEEFDYDALQAVLDEDAYDGGDWDAEQPANDYQEDEFGEDDDEKNLKDKASVQRTSPPVAHAALISPTEDDDYTQDNDFTEEVLSPLMSIASPNDDEDNYEDDTEPQALAITASPNAYADDDYTDTNDFDTTEPEDQLLQTASVDQNGGKVLAPVISPTATLDDEMDYTDDNDFNEDLEPNPLTIIPPQSQVDDAEETYSNASPVVSGDADGGNNTGTVLYTENTAFEDVVATILNEVDSVKENAVISPILTNAAIYETDTEPVPTIVLPQLSETRETDTLNEDDTYSNTSSQENLYVVDPSDYDAYTEDQVENKVMNELLPTAKPSTMEAGTLKENHNIANNTSRENLHTAELGDYDAYSDDNAIDENAHTSNLSAEQNSPEAEAWDENYSKSNTSSQDKLYELEPDEYDTYSDANANDENKLSTEQSFPEADGGNFHSNTSSQEKLYALEPDDYNTYSDGNDDRKNITELEPLIEPVLPVDNELTKNPIRISTSPQENEYTEEAYEKDLDSAGNIAPKIINELETSAKPNSPPELSAVNDNHTLNDNSSQKLLHTTGFDDNGINNDVFEEPKGVDEFEHLTISPSEPVDSPNDYTTQSNSSSRENLYTSDTNAFEDNIAKSADTSDADNITAAPPPTQQNDQPDINAASKDKLLTTEFDEYKSESLVDQGLVNELPPQPDVNVLYDDHHTYSNASSQENLYTTGTDEYDGYSDGVVDDKPNENAATATSESGNDQQWSYESSGEGSDNDDGYTYDDAMKEPIKDTISYHDDDAGKDTEDYYNTRNAVQTQHEDALNLKKDKLDESIVHHTDDELPTTEMLIPINVDEVNKTTHDELLNSTAKAMDEPDTALVESISFGVLTEKGPYDELNKTPSSEIILPLSQDFKQDDHINLTNSPLGSEKSASSQVIKPSSSSQSLRDRANEQSVAEANLQNSSPPSPNTADYELHHEKSAFDLSDQYQLQASNLAATTSNLLPYQNPRDEDDTMVAAIEILQECNSKAEIEPNLSSLDNIEQMSVLEEQTSKFAEAFNGQDSTVTQPVVAVDANRLLHQELNENLLPSASPCESNNSQAEYVADEFLDDISPTPPSNNSRRNPVNEATENWDNYEPEVIEDETVKMVAPAEENDSSVNSATPELMPQNSLKEIEEVKSNSQLVIATADLPLGNYFEPTPPSPIPNEAALYEYEEEVKVSTEAALPAEDENEYNADFVENAPQTITSDDTLTTSNDQPGTNLYDEENLYQPELKTPTEVVSDDTTENITSGENKPSSIPDYEDEYVDDVNEAAEDEDTAMEISSKEPPVVKIPVIASDNYEDVFEADEGSNQSNIDQNVTAASLSGISDIEQSQSLAVIAQEIIPQEQNAELAEEHSNESTDCYSEEVLVHQVAEAHTAQETYEEWSEDAENNESVNTTTENAVEPTALNASVENHVEPISSGVETTNDIENMQQDEAIIQSVHLEDTPSESNEGGIDENEEEDQVLLATVESLKKDITQVPSSGDNYLDEFRADDDDNADDDDINTGEAFYEEGFDEEPFESLASIRAKLGLPEAPTSNIKPNTSTQETQPNSDEHKPPVVVTTDEPNNPRTEQVAIPVDDTAKAFELTIDTEASLPSTDEKHQDTPNQSESIIAAMRDNQKPLGEIKAVTARIPTPERISTVDDIAPNSDSQTKDECLESSTLPNSNQITDKPPSPPCASNVSRQSITKTKDTTTPTIATRTPVTPRKPATQKDRSEKDNRKTKTLTPPRKEVATPSVSPAPSKLETKLKSRILASKPKKVEIVDRPPPPKPPVPRQTKVAVARPVENVVTPVRPKTATNLYHCPPTLSPRLPLDSKSAMAFNSPQKDYRPWRQDKPKSPKKKPVVVPASPPKVRFEPKVDKVKEEWLLLNMFRQGDASKYESFCHIPKHVERPSSADLQLRQSASYQTSTRKLVDPKKRSEQLSLEARERNWVDIPNRKTPIPAYEAILDKYCHTITSPYVQKQIYNTVNLSPQLAYVLEKRVQQQRQAEVAFLKQSPKMKPTRPSKPSPHPTSSHSSNDIVSLRWSNLSATKD